MSLSLGVLSFLNGSIHFTCMLFPDVGRLSAITSGTVLPQIVSELNGWTNIGPFADLGRIRKVVMAKVSAPSHAAARRKFKISRVACPNTVEKI